jgi:hypothetical protein
MTKEAVNGDPGGNESGGEGAAAIVARSAPCPWRHRRFVRRRRRIHLPPHSFGYLFLPLVAR